MNMITVRPLYYGHIGTLILVLITEVPSIQRSLNTLQYYTGAQNGVLIIEVSAIQRFVLERFHCISRVKTSVEKRVGLKVRLLGGVVQQAVQYLFD